MLLHGVVDEPVDVVGDLRCAGLDSTTRPTLRTKKYQTRMDVLKRSLASVGVEVDADLTTACHGDLVVGVRTVPDTSEHREWMRAAVHIAVKDDFPGLASCTVLVPPPATAPQVTEEEEDTSYVGMRVLATAIYHQIVSSYPWRDRARMYARIPALADEVVNATREGRAHVLTTGNVDALLPPCADCLLLCDEIRSVCSHTPLTLLDLYQHVYQYRDATWRLRAAAHVLFESAA